MGSFALTLTRCSPGFENEEVRTLTSQTARPFGLRNALCKWEPLTGRLLAVALANALKLYDEPPSIGLPPYRTHILVFALQYNPLHRDVSISMLAPPHPIHLPRPVCQARSYRNRDAGAPILATELEPAESGYHPSRLSQVH